MAYFLSAFVRSSEYFTLLTPGASNSIENAVNHWQHARKAFDNHPLSRRGI